MRRAPERGGLRLVRNTDKVSIEASCGEPQEQEIGDGWTVRETRSYGFDPDQMGRSTRPTGEIAYPLLPVPITPTTSAETRYLFRLCTMAVGSQEVALLTELEQVVQIGDLPPPIPEFAAGVNTLAIPDQGFAPANFLVQNLLWHFVDGNVTYALRYQPGIPAGGTGGRATTPNGTSDIFYGEGSALLAPASYVPDYLPAPGPVTPYRPPNAGQPVGTAVGDLGYFETVRFSPREKSQSALLAAPLPGPGLLVLYASVAQTDPNARPAIFFPGAPAAPDPGALSKEDRFVLAFPNAVYRKIGGSFRCDMVSVSCLRRLYGCALRGELPTRFLALGKVL